MLDCDEMPVIGNERPMRASAAANTPGAGDSSPLSARQNASQRRPRALVRSPEPSSHSTLRTAPSATMTRSLWIRVPSFSTTAATVPVLSAAIRSTAAPSRKSTP